MARCGHRTARLRATRAKRGRWIGATPLWKLATIPVVAGLIGYVTNWLAVKMTFRPLEFVGIRPWLGWQGIIPAKAKKMASIAVDSTVSKLGTLSEIFEQMDPERIAQHVIRTIGPDVPVLVDEIMSRENPQLWEALPPALRTAVVDRVQRRMPMAVDGLMKDIGAHIDQLMDLRLMVVDMLSEDRELLNRIFLEAGQAEFRFIINSGLWFGFLLGLLQMLVQWVVPGVWVLPVAGIAVGYVTNWLALNLIFRPLEPSRVGPVTLHGLFLRRQSEVAEVFCRMVTREILTLRNLVDQMLTGPRSDRTYVLIARHMVPLVDEAAGIARPAVELAVGDRQYSAIKEALATRAVGLTAVPFDDPAFNAERAVVVESLMRERMEAMAPPEFQELLRPAFQEDEIKLILVGAVLGGLAGLVQAVAVFGGG